MCSYPLNLKTQDLYSSLMDPLGLESLLEKFSKTIGPIVREDKSWDEVISCCSGPSVECCRLLEELRVVFEKCPNLQQKGEQ